MAGKPGNAVRIRDAERTRAALLDAAATVFLRDGYVAAATEEIVAVAGVTRGALYHHFASKRDLFRGVVERMQAEAEQTLTAIEGSDPWESFTAAVLASLDAVYDPAIRRLLLIEAPAVLGWAEVREGHRKNTITMTERALRAIARSSGETPAPGTALAHMIVAAVEEAMLYLAHSDDPVAERAEVQAQLLQLLDSVRRPAPVPARESS